MADGIRINDLNVATSTSSDGNYSDTALEIVGLYD